MNVRLLVPALALALLATAGLAAADSWSLDNQGNGCQNTWHPCADSCDGHGAYNEFYANGKQIVYCAK